MSASTATEPSVAFSVRDVTKVYRMGDVEVHALRGVTMELSEGEFVVLGNYATDALDFIVDFQF